MSWLEFRRVAAYIGMQYGITLTPVKKVMVEVRLAGRIRKTGMTSYQDYLNFVFSERGADELARMVDAITTHKTEFFREPDHFNALTDLVKSEWISRDHFFRPLYLWSAGCSSGEEAFSMAMVLDSCFVAGNAGTFRVIGTDVGSGVLETAVQAVYNEGQLSNVPTLLRRKYFTRQDPDGYGRVRVIPHLRQKVYFRRLNLVGDPFAFGHPLDIIFCRNVMIYLNKESQEQVVCKFARVLSPGGCLFVGHSETLHGMRVPFERIAPTIYRKLGSTDTADAGGPVL